MQESCITKEHPLTNQGFTLIEVLVTLGIFALVMTLALGVGFDTLTRSNAQTERDLAVHLLQKARARAMANMYESTHTFETDGVNYTLSYTDPVTGGTVREETLVGEGATVSSATIVFEQLSGDSSAETLTISSNSSDYVVEIETNGRINW